MTQDKYASLICLHSQEPERVATVLRLHGVPWDNAMFRQAAYLGNLALLHWLHSNGCQWDQGNILANASRGGSVAMLQWLVSVTAPWSERAMTGMLNAAACCDRLAAAQLLRARGAPWPDAFASDYEDTIYGVIKQCWSLTLVQWAVASGSDWREWKCEDSDADKYRLPNQKQQATDVLQWAHANGCPCTCGQQQQQQQQ
jgi:hypothetical protein